MFGTVGDFLVDGDLSRRSRRRSTRRSGDSLGDSGDFKDALGDLPGQPPRDLLHGPQDLPRRARPHQIDPNSQALLEKRRATRSTSRSRERSPPPADSFELESSAAARRRDTGELPARRGPLAGLARARPREPRRHWSSVTIDQLKSQIPDFDAVVQQIQATTGASLDELEGALGDAVLYVQGTTQPTLCGRPGRPDQGHRADRPAARPAPGPPAAGRARRGDQAAAAAAGRHRLPDQRSERSLRSRWRSRSRADKLVIGYGAQLRRAGACAGPDARRLQPFSVGQGSALLARHRLLPLLPVRLRVAEATARSGPRLRAGEAVPRRARLPGHAAPASSGDQGELKAVLGLK